MVPYGVISLRRAVEYEGAFHSYQVLIDGVLAGRVRTGRTVVLPVLPGTHRIQVTQLWSASAPLTLEIRPGSRHHLVTGNGRWRDAFIHPRRCLRIVPLPVANG